METLTKYFGDFTTQQLAQYEALLPLYKSWNEKINVISRKDIDTIYERHVLHSLALAATIDFQPGAQVVDIGTGGGFPGIPLAIFFPDVNFTLVDSIGKKIKVVQAVADDLGLKNVTALHTRVENLPKQSFDYAVSRAVAPLGDLWRWIKPYLAKGRQTPEFANGLFCLKGGDLAQEIHDSGLRPHVFDIHEYFPEPYFNDKYVVYAPR